MAAAADFEQLRVEARYARERRDLYRAKMYGPRRTSPARMRELERVLEAAEARRYARSSSATHSMCGVCGNMSTGRTRRSAQPASTSCAAFGASVVGLHDT